MHPVTAPPPTPTPEPKPEAIDWRILQTAIEHGPPEPDEPVVA